MRQIDEWIHFLQRNETIYPKIMSDQFLMCVIDEQYIIQYTRDFQSDIPVPFEVGQVLPDTSTSALSIREQKTISRLVPKEIYGVEMRTTSVPFEDGSGCVSVISNIKTLYEVSASFEQIIASTEQISASSQTSSAQAQEMESNFSNIMTSVQNTIETNEALHGIYKIIKSIADDLRLISINAMIQSAHAGASGSGFSVVANEFRSLADQTATHLENVSQTIERINLHAKHIETEVTRFNEYIKAQTETSKEISAAISSVTESSLALQQIMNSLLKA